MVSVSVFIIKLTTSLIYRIKILLLTWILKNQCGKQYEGRLFNLLHKLLMHLKQVFILEIIISSIFEA